MFQEQHHSLYHNESFSQNAMFTFLSIRCDPDVMRPSTLPPVLYSTCPTLPNFSFEEF